MNGFILASVAATVFAVSSGYAQSYSFLKVVDAQTVVPGGGTIQPDAPVIEGAYVVFGERNRSTLWSANIETGALVKLAGFGTALPGTASSVDHFERYFLKKGILVFHAVGAGGFQGLYTIPVTGGAIARLVDTTATIPGTSFLFQSFDRGSASHNGSLVVFGGQSPGVQGVYSVRMDGTGLAQVADTNTPVTSDSCNNFPVATFSLPSINSFGNIAVRGQTVMDSAIGFGGYYLGPLKASLDPNCAPFPTIVNSNGRPNGTPPIDNFHGRLFNGWLDGLTYYYKEDDSHGTYGGIYSAPAIASIPGGTASRIVDSTTPLPGFGPVEFANNFDFAVDQGLLVFRCTDQNGQREALFLSAGGAISRLVGFGDTLDGNAILGVDAPIPGAVSGSAVAFVWKHLDSTFELSVGRTASVDVSIQAITNAASYNATAIAPGEVVTVFGSGLGPDTLATATLDATGGVSKSLKGARLLFDGIAAPMV